MRFFLIHPIYRLVLEGPLEIMELKVTRGRPGTEWTMNIKDCVEMRYEDLVRSVEDHGNGGS